MTFSPIPDVLADIAAGKMVIVVDDESRENEGDLVMAAERVTPEAINFMRKHGGGLICLPLTGEKCDRLKLELLPGELLAVVLGLDPVGVLLGGVVGPGDEDGRQAAGHGRRTQLLRVGEVRGRNARHLDGLPQLLGQRG